MKIITSSTPAPLVTVAEAKQHSRIDTSDDDLLLSGYIAAATELAEQETGQHFVQRECTIYYDAWPAGDCLKLPMYPLQAVNSVKYLDADNNLQTMDTADYVVDLTSIMPRIVLADGATWPTADLYPVSAVAIAVSSGYAAIDDVPQQASQVIRLMVGQWYEYREALQPAHQKELPLGLKRLLWSIRVAL